jgi:glycosyltransferase involved in cell wall biosynthesis
MAWGRVRSTPRWLAWRPRSVVCGPRARRARSRPTIVGFVRLWPSHRPVGGMQLHALELYCGLAARGHEVHVLTTSHPRHRHEVADGVHVHYLDGCPAAVYSPEYTRRAGEQVRALDAARPIDVIHSESTAALGQTGSRLPVVATWHGLAYCRARTQENRAMVAGTPLAESVRAEARREIEADLRDVARFDASIAISHQAFDDLRDIYRIPEDRLHLVFNGLDPGHFNIDPVARREVRAHHGIPPDARVLGVVGRIDRPKGHAQLIELLGPLLRDLADAYVLIVGEGDLVARYTALAHPRIIYAGSRPHPDMKRYYNAMDLLVNPTQHHSGLDLTMSEAMACGVPVLASDVGSIKRSLLPAWRHGTTFRLGDRDDFDAKLRIMLRRSDLGDLGRAARAFVISRFTVDEMCARTERALETAILGKHVATPEPDHAGEDRPS